MEKRKWKLMVLAVCSALAISGCASNESEKKETATGEYAVEIILADSAAKGAAGEQFDRAFAEKLEKITAIITDMPASTMGAGFFHVTAKIRQKYFSKDSRLLSPQSD